jgi:hypothetical protein
MTESGGVRVLSIPDVTGRKGVRAVEDLRRYQGGEESGVYLQPEVSGFLVVDALVTPLTGYKMTARSTSEDIDVESMGMLLDELGCTKDRKFRLVWVVPNDIRFTCTPLRDTIADRVEQFVVKMPLVAPPSLAKAISGNELSKRKLVVL